MAVAALGVLLRGSLKNFNKKKKLKYIELSTKKLKK